jgi:hypothetical protein
MKPGDLVKTIGVGPSGDRGQIGVVLGNNSKIDRLSCYNAPVLRVLFEDAVWSISADGLELVSESR